MDNQKLYTVLLLAGHRSVTNEISNHYQVRYKALAPVANRPMITYPLNCLQKSKFISKIIVLSQESEKLKGALKQYDLKNNITFLDSYDSIAKTIISYREKQQPGEALLITTADNCLLTTGDIETFLKKADEQPSDISIGVINKNKLLSVYPESRRSWIKFKDTDITGCNLFLLHGKHATSAIKFWEKFENSPKHIIKLAWHLGPNFFWCYWRQKITIKDSFNKISTVSRAKITPIFLDNPEIAIDADKLSDIEQIERILRRNKGLPTVPVSINNNLGRPIVIFDLDNTITTFATYTPFLLYYILKHNPLRLVYIPIIIIQLILFILKLRNRKQLKTIMFKLLVGCPKKMDLITTSSSYVERILKNHVYSEALKTICYWQDKKALLVLATASYDWLANIFANRLGFNQVISTRSLENNGYIIAGIDGENCYGHEKLVMVSATIGPIKDLINAGHEVWFYSDHHSDISLLAECSHPVGVNPTSKLATWIEDRENTTKLKWVRKHNQKKYKRF